jgi:hypothetical protein
MMAILFCLLAPLASALSDSDKTTAENAVKPFVESGMVERIDVIISPPDGITYNIIPNSASDEDLATAEIVGIDLFSVLTNYHPEVTNGIIGLIWDVPTGGSKVLFLNIYPSDLGQIADRQNPTLSESMQVANTIIERAAQEKQKVSEPKTEKPSRSVTYSLDGKPQTFTVYGDLTSNPGYFAQTTKSERIVSKSDPLAFVEIKIRTAIDKSLKPLNEDNEMQKDIKLNMDEIKRIANGATVKDKPTYEVTLANGYKVTVHPFKAVPFTYNGNYVFASFMLDSNTIVTISSTENKQEFDEVLRTLKIGELQNAPYLS